MFERFNTPEEIFTYKLGSALSMERQLVDLLDRLEKCTLREEIRHPLAVHREETLQHVANIEHCFKLLDEPVDDSPCGVIEALANESKTMIKKSDDSLPDVLILAVASEAEHYEIAVYETLIANADARRGATAVAKLLRENLAQDKHALTIARTLMKTILEQGIAVDASA
jgi:ferritin-like metal-binding protein YciE